MNKRERAMQNYTGFRGAATVEHVERNIKTAYPTAYADLTGVQYGKLMSVANVSYQDGKHSNNQVEAWAYDSELDWLAGFGRGKHSIEVAGDTITLTLNLQQDNEIKTIYKRV